MNFGYFDDEKRAIISLISSSWLMVLILISFDVWVLIFSPLKPVI